MDQSLPLRVGYMGNIPNTMEEEPGEDAASLASSSSSLDARRSSRIVKRKLENDPENAIPLVDMVYTSSMGHEQLPKRKRSKTGETHDEDTLHEYNSEIQFRQLQRTFHGPPIGQLSSATTHGRQMRQDLSKLEDDTEIDVLGSDNDEEDGYSILSTQWMTQKQEPTRKKRRRKSLPFSERRQSIEEVNSNGEETEEPRRWVGRPKIGVEDRVRSKTQSKTFGNARSRMHSSKRDVTLDDDILDEEEFVGNNVNMETHENGGDQGSSAVLYIDSNIKTLKNTEEEDDEANVIDDDDDRKAEFGSSRPVAHPTPIQFKKPSQNPTSNTSISSPSLARRSLRLNAVKVADFEYDATVQPLQDDGGDMMDYDADREPIHTTTSSSAPVTPKSIKTASSAKKVSKTMPVKQKKPTPMKSQRSKFDHGIVTTQQINEFYASLQPVHYQKKIQQPKGMVPVLFAYQLRAVSWMIERESTLFKQDHVRGGLLADEMGLGKTIEMIGLILSNPRSKFIRPADFEGQEVKSLVSNPSLSPSEMVTSQATSPNTSSLRSHLKIILKFDDSYVDPPLNYIDSTTSLIVCPDILLQQWKEEMHKHSPNLSIHTYKGVPLLTPLEKAMDRAGDDIFALYDVVLCSYETLAKEFPYATKPNVKTRFSVEQPSTPMTKIRWWRICMDEAQMFSQGASNAGKLLRNLNCVNRWAVSGTPIRKDFTDIRGLLLFLGVEHIYYRPTTESLAFIRQISWRHQMEQVNDEIIIPPAETHVLKVQLSTLESFGASRLSQKFSKLISSSTGTNNLASASTISEPFSFPDTIQNINNQPTNTPSTASLLPPPNPSTSTPAPLAEIVSLHSAKYSSCPYQVLLDRYLEQRAILPHADRALLARSLATHISNEFYSSQLAVCTALNAVGDAYLLKAKQLKAPAHPNTVSLDPNSGNPRYYATTQAITHYQKALDLVTYKTDSQIYMRLVQLSTSFFILSPPSAPFSTVCYHTLVNLVQALKLQGRQEEAELLEQRAESVRGTALQSQLNLVASARFKFHNTKQETSRLIRNRLQCTRGEWWVHALKWIGENVPDFCARLRRGVRQQFDLQFQMMRSHVLQLNVATVDDVIDKLDLDLTRLLTQRQEAVNFTKAQIPTEGSRLLEFYATLDHTDETLYAYQQLLVRDIEVDGFSGVVQTKVLNLAERLLLFIEFVLVERHNPIMNTMRFNPERVSPEEERTLFQLARWLLMAEATFRELELMKIELTHGQAYNSAKRDYAASLDTLEESAQAARDGEEYTHNHQSEEKNSLGMPPTNINMLTTHHTMETTSADCIDMDNNTNKMEVSTQCSVISLRQTGQDDTPHAIQQFEKNIAKLNQSLNESVANCVSLKHQLEFVLESGREKVPRYQSFGSKINIIVEKLREVLKDDEAQSADPTLLKNKALIFSMWHEPLIQLSVILRELGIQFKFGKDAGLDGNRGANLSARLAAFRDDPEVRVLLLNSKSQSTGLTLTQANHVFILEDVESAHELQAIGRAHRIGQTRVTHIWKFQVSLDSLPQFEEKVELF